MPSGRSAGHVQVHAPPGVAGRVSISMAGMFKRGGHAWAGAFRKGLGGSSSRQGLRRRRTTPAGRPALMTTPSPGAGAQQVTVVGQAAAIRKADGERNGVRPDFAAYRDDGDVPAVDASSAARSRPAAGQRRPRRRL